MLEKQHVVQAEKAKEKEYGVKYAAEKAKMEAKNVIIEAEEAKNEAVKAKICAEKAKREAEKAHNELQKAETARAKATPKKSVIDDKNVTSHIPNATDKTSESKVESVQPKAVKPQGDRKVGKFISFGSLQQNQEPEEDQHIGDTEIGYFPNKAKT